MAEARAEEDEDRLREPGSARRRAEHSDRNKPDQRHSSQGPLSSIRAVIKRTSARTSSQSDPQRDRRRPEITILSAEPLPSNTWFPGASGAFPPAPPPAPPTWAASSATVQLPPPSYEQVIREKSREQNLHSSSSSSSPLPSSRHSTSTIATQTDTNSPGPQSSAARPVRKPSKPPRPSLPLKLTTEGDWLNRKTQPREALREQCGVQTDFDDVDDIIDDISPIGPAPPAITSPQINLDSPRDPMKEEPSIRPRPRPRSRLTLQPSEDVLDQPMTREVKVQTLVRLKDDGAENVFAGFDDAPSDISSKYLQDLLEVFGSDETHVEHGESRQSHPSTTEKEENVAVFDAPCTPEPAEPIKRPQPRPRTQKSKPQLTPKPSVFEVFDSREPATEQNPSKPVNPPVPAPRPLLNKLQSPSETRSAKPSPVARPDSAPPGQQGAAVASTPSKRRNSADQTTNPPVKTSPVIAADRSAGKRPSVPRLSRPPPPVLKKTPPTSQATVDVLGAPDASIPSLPPRPSGGKLLPLRPPPIKVTKLPGSAPSPAVTNQLSGSRVPKRRPPLPPRPKPGHPLYKRYSSKVLQGDAELENSSKEQEEPPEETSLHEEEHLIVLDDKDVPQTPPDTLHDLCSSGEVKGQDVTVSELLLDKEPLEQQIQQNTQNRCVVARFAFEGEEGELSFTEGDVIALVEYVNEEWGRGLLNGETGIFPLSFIQAIEETEASPLKPAMDSPAPPAGARGRALYDFTPECEDELCLKTGDVVCGLEDMDAEWFLGESGGKRGIIPKNYIQVLDP